MHLQCCRQDSGPCVCQARLPALLLLQKSPSCRPLRLTLGHTVRPLLLIQKGLGGSQDSDHNGVAQDKDDPGSWSCIWKVAPASLPSSQRGFCVTCRTWGWGSRSAFEALEGWILQRWSVMGTVTAGKKPRKQEPTGAPAHLWRAECHSQHCLYLSVGAACQDGSHSGSYMAPSCPV